MLKYVIALALVITSSAPTFAADKASLCKGEGKLRSKVSKVATQIDFANNTDGAVDIYWLDYRGKRKLYRKMIPRGSYSQDTFLTHPWIAVSASGTCHGPFIPKKSGIKATIE